MILLVKSAMAAVEGWVSLLLNFLSGISYPLTCRRTVLEAITHVCKWRVEMSADPLWYV